MLASHKLFYSLVHNTPDVILRYWLLPAVVPEAQMAADPDFLLRLQAEPAGNAGPAGPFHS